MFSQNNEFFDEKKILFIILGVISFRFFLISKNKIVYFYIKKGRWSRPVTRNRKKHLRIYLLKFVVRKPKF